MMTLSMIPLRLDLPFLHAKPAKARTPSNPLESTLAPTFAKQLPMISKQTFAISGISTCVYGLEEIPAHVEQVACLWLLHPRLSDQARMQPVAATAINRWNAVLSSREANDQTPAIGLIAVCFDQCNHGSREVSPQANEAWRSGNRTHAQDMFSIYRGTAIDTSLLLDYLPSYVFPDCQRSITTNIVLGISLGGHAAWQALMHEPRISAGIIIIGCADYASLMTDRAAKSRLPSWTATSPPGASFFGSPDFPRNLVEAVERSDPAAILFGGVSPSSRVDGRCSTETEIERMRPLMEKHLAGKKILNLSGGADKLVPYSRSEPFLRLLNEAVNPRSGWFSDKGTELTDKIYEGVGHEMTKEMLNDAVDFICETLGGSAPLSHERRPRPWKI
ncbi:MAG: hypothetical protein M1825_004959 [Sarcosagium campestre]|nr:MAG: hypothetical protein M1825_004959 [Sarcosagium campestre]